MVRNPYVLLDKNGTYFYIFAAHSALKTMSQIMRTGADESLNGVASRTVPKRKGPKKIDIL